MAGRYIQLYIVDNLNQSTNAIHVHEIEVHGYWLYG